MKLEVTKKTIFQEPKPFWGSPPGCPNIKCPSRSSLLPGSSKFKFNKKGTRRLLDGTVRGRYRCRVCGKYFSSSTFNLNFRFQKRGHLSARVFYGVVRNQSNRAMSRELGVSESCIRHRIRRLCQIGLQKHLGFLKKTKLEEELAYDGLEAFAYSQYEPCNINQVVGADSLFAYIFNFAPMNRKGRMSPRQKAYLAAKESVEGRFDPRAIRKATGDIFRELLRMRSQVVVDGGITVRSDEHFQYRRALEKDLTPDQRERILHKTVNSKECRNYKNILFSVNHLDLVIRREVAAFTRETICFSKKDSAMVEKYILFICNKNYMRPAFTKAHKRDPDSNLKSPAMRLGLTKKLLSFGELFYFRDPTIVPSSMPLDWKFTLEGKSAFTREMKFLKSKF